MNKKLSLTSTSLCGLYSLCLETRAIVQARVQNDLHKLMFLVQCVNGKHASHVQNIFDQFF